MSRIALLLLLLLSGCAPAAPAPSGPQPPPRPVLTLRVENQSLDKMAVYLGPMRIGTVMAGETRLLRIPQAVSGTARLTAEAQHGSADFVVGWAPEATLCWSWRIPMVGSAGATFPVPCDVSRATSTARALVQVWLEEDAHGLAYCGTKPTAWVNAETVGTREGRHTVVHELAHLRQMRADGSCEAHKARVEADPTLMARNEAEAYCESAKVWSEQERIPLQQAVARFAGWLATYPFGLSVPQAAALIWSTCNAA